MSGLAAASCCLICALLFPPPPTTCRGESECMDTGPAPTAGWGLIVANCSHAQLANLRLHRGRHAQTADQSSTGWDAGVAIRRSAPQRRWFHCSLGAPTSGCTVTPEEFTEKGLQGPRTACDHSPKFVGMEEGSLVKRWWKQKPLTRRKCGGCRLAVPRATPGTGWSNPWRWCIGRMTQNPQASVYGDPVAHNREGHDMVD